ncbi:MAG: hypothetical protein R3A78_09375 [Polyangiales bacterium]
MSRKFQTFSLPAVFLGLLLGVAAPVVAPTSKAHAQTEKQIDSNIQGTVGLGLIGAEVGLMIPALADMDGAWPYIVFPVALGAGGGVAGYFLIDDNNHVNAGVAVLATGVALIIPAVVTALALTAYDPDDDESLTSSKAKVLKDKDFGDADAEDQENAQPSAPAPTEQGAPAAETPATEAAPAEPAPSESPPPATETPSVGAPQSRNRVLDGGFGLVRYSSTGAVKVGVPIVSVGSVYSASDVQRYGVRQQTEVQVPILTGTF